jgi:ABC-2 type transport system permease protein
MCILAAMIAYMSGMNPALSTAVSREGKGHDFIKALPVSSRTIILAKLAVGYALQATGVIGAGIAITIIVPGFLTETILAVVLCLIFDLGCACMALSRDVRKPRLDWVTEQEAVKQNFGVMISMLVSWGILIALAGLSVLMIHVLEMGMIPVFAVLGVLLALLLWISYRKLMKNVDQYYCAG